MIRLALLQCDMPIPTVRAEHGTYLDIFKSLLRKSLERTRPHLQVDWILDGYDVVSGEYPSDQKIKEYDAILISGSSATAYAPLEWISTLLNFVRKVTSEYSEVRIFGICFGHQIVSLALGAECTRNDKGWEIGTHEVELTEIGRNIFGRDVLRIQEFHRDIVPDLPPHFKLLGSTPKCAVQGMVKFRSSGEQVKSLSDIHIISVQGHPEFLPDIVQKMTEVREKAGTIDLETAAEGHRRAGGEHDGVDVIANIFWDILVPTA